MKKYLVSLAIGETQINGTDSILMHKEQPSSRTQITTNIGCKMLVSGEIVQKGKPFILLEGL